jgi:hypothetical protein
MLYQDSEELALWHDAFGSVLIVSLAVPEEPVAKFAADVALAYSAPSS